jgi:hypothetical protein
MLMSLHVCLGLADIYNIGLYVETIKKLLNHP